MPEDKFTVFAYGSNMLSSRIRERCPSATSVGAVILPSYGLRWHKRSKKDGSGKCDIAEGTALSVHGVLYAISVSDKPALDKAEGLGKGYEQIDIAVLRDGETISAIAYKATDIDSTLRPYSWYRALVVKGADENRLPPAYVEQLRAVPAIEDPDRARHDRHMSLCEEATA